MSGDAPSGACSTLLCDNCISPGACCKNFTLSLPGVYHDSTELEVMVKLASIVHYEYCGQPYGGGAVPSDALHVMIGLPFSPLPHVEGTARRYKCNWLGTDGRCGNYDGRPALCRGYKAASDAMCAMYVAPEPLKINECGKVEI